jgi:hypothetical protein
LYAEAGCNLFTHTSRIKLNQELRKVIDELLELKDALFAMERKLSELQDDLSAVGIFFLN